MDILKLFVAYLLGAIVVLFFILAIAYIVNALTFYKLAKKAGMNSEAWMAWIPILQNILFLHMIDKSGWHVLVFFTPGLISLLPETGIFAFIGLILSIAVVVIGIMWLVDLLKRFGQNPLWVITIFIPFVFAIYMLYVAFSSDVRYVATNRYQDQYQGNDTYNY